MTRQTKKTVYTIECYTIKISNFFINPHFLSGHSDQNGATIYIGTNIFYFTAMNSLYSETG